MVKKNELDLTAITNTTDANKKEKYLNQNVLTSFFYASIIIIEPYNL